MNLPLILIPLLAPLGTALLVLFFERYRRVLLGLSFIGSSVHLASAVLLLQHVRSNGIASLTLGGWSAPFGITLAADTLSTIMLVVSSLAAWSVLLYAFATVERARERAGFFAMYQFLLLGVSGAFLAGDMFNLYVWFEVMLISSFVLMTLGGERAQLEGGLKYVVINLVASFIFLVALGLTYGATGTLNVAQLAEVIGRSQSSPLLTALPMLFLVSFGIKAAIFPLYFWLPASYHTPPVPVTALFGGLLTKVGVYALFRTFTTIFPEATRFSNDVILALAGLTMLTGVLGALAQSNVRRILSFHIVSQIGYMLMGLGLATAAGLAGGILYIGHHIVVKTALLMIGGALEYDAASGELDEMGGYLKKSPALAVMFLVAALSLAGIPPLSGFFSKLSLLQAAVDDERWIIASVSLVVSLLTLLSMVKIWNGAFWKPKPKDAISLGHLGLRVKLPIVFLIVLTLLIGFAPQPFYSLTAAAGLELLEPATYTATILGR